jgi:hypothetical protein
MALVHVAIMRKSWGLTSKILSGEKTFELRWYKYRRPPWDSISADDTIYFKDSGEPVSISAKVYSVQQIHCSNQKERERILSKYARGDLGTPKIPPAIKNYVKNKSYCLIICLKNPKKIKPFAIDKRGFGAMSPWITVGDIEKIKRLPAS